MKFPITPERRCHPSSKLWLALAAAALVNTAHSFEIDTNNPDLKLRWDNTVRYSAAARLKERLPSLAGTVIGASGIVGPNNINQDDGDNNFNRGLVSSRVDVLSEIDLAYGNFGARVTGAAWYDQIYNRSTDNTTRTNNHTPASEFTREAREIMGRKAELLDAFVYGRFNLGATPATIRLGRHTLLWGESLFYGANGISGGMAPIDIVKASSVPNSQFKEIVRPTGKLSGQVQISPSVTAGGYLPYDWEKSRLPPAGAYLNAIDPGGPGGEALRVGARTLTRAPDLDAKKSGQGGVQVRVRADSVDTDFGFYAIRFHALTPSNVIFNGAPPTTATQYRFLHHEGISVYGASAARTIAEWSLAGELSMRKNMPLASASQVSPGFQLNNNSNPGYAVGDTAHAQFSWLASLGPSLIANEASFVGEIAWNTRLKFTQNERMANPNASRSATGMRTAYTPTYRQVISGLDLSPSVGVGYTLGKSSALGSGFGVHRGGDLNIGLGAVYLGVWNMNLNYVHYFGSVGGTNDNAGNAQYRQALKDRNYVSLSLRTTF